MNLVNQIRKELKQNIDVHIKASAQNFFKEKVKVHGVKTVVVTKIAKEYKKRILSLNKREVFTLCEELWQSGYLEESFIACHYAYLIRENYDKEDFRVFEKWVNEYVSNWASCDTLCNHTLGAFIEKYPAYVKELRKWAKSCNRWVRRASAVSLIIPARKGKFLNDIFAIADIMIKDQDDLVQKGYGWLLKEASKSYQQEVFNYVIRNKKIMPRTALRYAIEKMPPELRKQAMNK